MGKGGVEACEACQQGDCYDLAQFGTTLVAGNGLPGAGLGRTRLGWFGLGWDGLGCPRLPLGLSCLRPLWGWNGMSWDQLGKAVG